MIHDDAVSLTLQFFENLKILNFDCNKSYKNYLWINVWSCVVRKQADPACLVTFT